MPEPHIPCPSCTGAIRVRKSGALYADDRTGLLVRECLVECAVCGRKGKMLATLDIGLYPIGAGEVLRPEACGTLGPERY